MDMTTTTIFDVIIFFQYFSVFSDGLQKKTLIMPQNHRAGTLIGFCAQRVLKAWKELLSKSPFTDFSKAMSPYMLFDNSACRFPALSTRSEGLSLLLQQKKLVDVSGVLKGEEFVETAVFYWSVNTDDMLC